MQSLGFEQKNPTIYNMIAELDYDNREVDFEEFLSAIIDKLGDKVSTLLFNSHFIFININQETKEGINKIFDLFDEDGSNSINLSNLRKVAKELGETMSNDELAEMLERAA